MENISELGAINRREFERFEFANPIILEGEKFQVIPDVCARNLSQRGACISTRTPLQIGSIVTAEIPSSKLHLIAEVCWVRPDSDSKYEVGVIFHELFPQTKQQISDLIHQIRIEPVVEADQAPSLELENGIASYLDQYVEEIKPDPIETYPTIRRIPAPSENSFSVYTPSKSRWLELTSTSFRLENKTAITKPKVYLRAVLLFMILAAALGLYLYMIKNTMKQVYSEIEPSASISPIGISKTIAINETNFEKGSLEKLSWTGDAKHFQIVLTFRDEIKSDQLEISRNNVYQISEIIKIIKVQSDFDPKSIAVMNPLVQQIRLGLHQNENQYDLHISVDLKDLNVEIANKTLANKTLTIDFKPVNKV